MRFLSPQSTIVDLKDFTSFYNIVWAILLKFRIMKIRSLIIITVKVCVTTMESSKMNESKIVLSLWHGFSIRSYSLYHHLDIVDILLGGKLT